MLRLLLFGGNKESKGPGTTQRLKAAVIPVLSSRPAWALKGTLSQKQKQHKNSTNKDIHYSRAWLPNLVTRMSSLALKTVCLACSLMWETVTTQPCQGVWKECKHVWPARPHDRCREPEDSATLGLTVLPLCDTTSRWGRLQTHLSLRFSEWRWSSELCGFSELLQTNWQTFLPWCSTEILPPHSSWSCYLTQRQLSCTANQEQWLWSQTRRSHTYHGVPNIPG